MQNWPMYKIEFLQNCRINFHPQNCRQHVEYEVIENARTKKTHMKLHKSTGTDTIINEIRKNSIVTNDKDWYLILPGSRMTTRVCASHLSVMCGRNDLQRGLQELQYLQNDARDSQNMYWANWWKRRIDLLPIEKLDSGKREMISTMFYCY